MMTVNTDRKKVLQTGASMRVRAVRSVHYSAYQVHFPYRDLLTNHGPSQDASNVVVAEEMVLAALVPSAMLPAFKTACTHILVRPALPRIMGRPHELLSTPHMVDILA